MQVVLEPAILQQQQIHIIHSNILKNRKGLKLLKREGKKRVDHFRYYFAETIPHRSRSNLEKEDLLEASLLKRPVVIRIKIVS